MAFRAASSTLLVFGRQCSLGISGRGAAHMSSSAATSADALVVIGGTGALGASIVHRFADPTMGAATSKVISVDFMPNPEAHASIVCKGNKPWKQECRSIVSQIKKEIKYKQGGRVGAVIHAAGGFLPGNLKDGFDAVEDLVEMNFNSAWLTGQVAAETLDEDADDGLVVLTGAMGAFGDGTTSFAVGYGMCKAATHKLAETMANEAEACGLPPATRTLCILPGVIDTPANAAAMPDADKDEWTPPLAIADAVLAWHAAAKGTAMPPGIDERLPRELIHLDDNALFVGF